MRGRGTGREMSIPLQTRSTPKDYLQGRRFLNEHCLFATLFTQKDRVLGRWTLSHTTNEVLCTEWRHGWSGDVLEVGYFVDGIFTLTHASAGGPRPTHMETYHVQGHTQGSALRSSGPGLPDSVSPHPRPSSVHSHPAAPRQPQDLPACIDSPSSQLLTHLHSGLCLGVTSSEALGNPIHPLSLRVTFGHHN